MSIRVASDNSLLQLKFDSTVKVNSITGSGLTLFKQAATPIAIASPFDTINLANDFNSISRTLTLYFRSPIEINTAYTLYIAGLIRADGSSIPTIQENFVSSDHNPSVVEPARPVAEISIIDKSIVPTPIQTVSTSVGAFRVVGIDPQSDGYTMLPDQNNGRITIKFSKPPAIEYITPSYFMVQKKKLGVGIEHRWEPVATKLSMDVKYNWVHIDLPSTDTPPVYYLADHTYFETGCKYRLKLSAYITT